jgi:diadenosine tetraphosphate (Ap4A) HIT family hydrolase
MTIEANPCPFCRLPTESLVCTNALAFAIWDGFPVTPFHALVIPRRHVSDYFGLTEAEVVACHQLLVQVRQQVLGDDPTVEGFNLGMNAGAVAGQTIFHCHLHVIPRRAGDVPNPRGGVRHIIPGKGDYPRP